MFFGEYKHQIDEKCRIRIPSKLKDLLGERPFIMRGSNKCLVVLREADANVMLANQFKDVEIVDPQNNLSLRMLTSSAFFAEEDKQGRILLPSKLLEHAHMKEKGSDKINKNIVIIGAFNRVEIWNEEVWEKYTDLSDEEFDKSLADTLKASRSKKDN